MAADETNSRRSHEKGGDQSYLLRCWQENGQWRFSLETIGPHRRRKGFRSLEDVVTFLRSQLSPPDRATPTQSPPA